MTPFIEIVQRISLSWQSPGTPRGGAAIDKCADVNVGDSNPEVTVTVLKTGAYVKDRDELSMTTLNWAAMHNRNLVVITALVKAGADFEARDVAADIPLMLASRYNPNPAYRLPTQVG